MADVRELDRTLRDGLAFFGALGGPMEASLDALVELAETGYERDQRQIDWADETLVAVGRERDYVKGDMEALVARAEKSERELAEARDWNAEKYVHRAEKAERERDAERVAGMEAEGALARVTRERDEAIGLASEAEDEREETTKRVAELEEALRGLVRAIAGCDVRSLTALDEANCALAAKETA